jgi:hypothetical protein
MLHRNWIKKLYVLQQGFKILTLKGVEGIIAGETGRIELHFLVESSGGSPLERAGLFNLISSIVPDRIRARFPVVLNQARQVRVQRLPRRTLLDYL